MQNDESEFSHRARWGADPVAAPGRVRLARGRSQAPCAGCAPGLSWGLVAGLVGLLVAVATAPSQAQEIDLSDPEGASATSLSPEERAQAAAEEAKSAAERARAEADADSPNSRALEEAVARAEAAADQAALAARAVDRARRKDRWQTQRTGLYLGAAFFYAAENFEDRIIVKSSTGGAGILGYRLASFFAVEARYEVFEGFDLEGQTGRGEIDGSALTLSGKVYPFIGAVQPYLGLGLGAIFLEQKIVFNDGSRSREEDADAAFRGALGLDFWLTDSLVLNAEAAYLAPADDLSNLESTILSTGLSYRF